jgi:hypothetical protein
MFFFQFIERKKAPTPIKEFEKKDEENWALKNVVFVEDVKTVPVGKVIKVICPVGQLGKMSELVYRFMIGNAKPINYRLHNLCIKNLKITIISSSV